MCTHSQQLRAPQSPPAAPAADVPRALSRPFDALVVSYDLFTECASELAGRKFKVVVLVVALWR